MASANGNAEHGYTPERILITGGAGFIASHVTKLLVTKYPQYKVDATQADLRACSTSCTVTVKRTSQPKICKHIVSTFDLN